MTPPTKEPYKDWAWPCLLREVKSLTQDEYMDRLITCQKGLGNLGNCPFCHSETMELANRMLRLYEAENPKVIALRKELIIRVKRAHPQAQA